jgi:predicted O-linked N-acetylglucosamine transferase (SPINDLY family)
MAKGAGAPAQPAAGVQAALHAGVAHQQAGRLEQAAAAYRQVLAAAPRNFDALHLLGVVALQQGAFDEAVRLIEDALKLQASNAAAHGNLGTAHLRAGRLAQARSAFERAAKLQPSSAAAWYNLGTVLSRLGQAKEAVPAFRRAAAIDPKSAAHHTALGAALLDTGDAKAAVGAFDMAAKLDASRAECWTNLATARLRADDAAGALASADKALALAASDPLALGARGSALAALGRHEEAGACFEWAVRSAPRSAVALTNLGTFQRDSGRLDAALATLTEAVQLDPQLLPAGLALLQVWQALGRADEALSLARRLCEQSPASAVARTALGTMLFERGELIDAGTQLQLAVELPAADASAWLALGNLRMAEAQVGGAVQAYQRALALDASNARARWALTMASLKPIYPDDKAMLESRERFSKALVELDAWFTPQRRALGPQAVGSTQPFYLAYQPLNNRELLARYGALCSRLMAPDAPVRATAAPTMASPRRLRIGIASAHVRDHSVWNAITRGWVTQLDRQRFEIHLFKLAPAADAQTERARRLVDHFVEGARSPESWAATIAEHRLDALIYPEIGMDSMTTKLAAQRLAPLQAATWGHPETTGLPTIDAFLSADLLEPAEADGHYTERLVRLPNLGVCCERSSVSPVAPELAAWGLPDDEPLLLCAGTPFKYSPRHDAVWARIASGLRRGRLVFFRGGNAPMSELLEQRLRKAFERAGTDPARLRFIPTLDRARFFGLMHRATLYLDSIGFSGFNTALQAIECGLPVVSCEGEFMRGRLGSGPLRRMGVLSTLAVSEDDYVERVLRLAEDDAARFEVQRGLISARDGLFDDVAPVRALERWLVESIAAA